jgi:hypothetical protein
MLIDTPRLVPLALGTSTSLWAVETVKKMRLFTIVFIDHISHKVSSPGLINILSPQTPVSLPIIEMKD